MLKTSRRHGERHWGMISRSKRQRAVLPRRRRWDRVAQRRSSIQSATCDRNTLHRWNGIDGPQNLGDHLVMSFCNSLRGSYGTRGKKFDPVGIFPLDESVYGIRDLAGSMSE